MVYYDEQKRRYHIVSKCPKHTNKARTILINPAVLQRHANLPKKTRRKYTYLFFHNINLSKKC